MRIPAASVISSRDATLAKDALLTNAFFEASDASKFPMIVKRPGLILTSSAMIGTQARGLHSAYGYLWAVVDSTLYQIVPGVSYTNVGTLSTTTGPVWFCSTLDDTYIFLHDGTYGYTLYQGAGFAVIPNTQLGFPTYNGYTTGQIAPGCVYLDGRVYIQTVPDAKVWGSTTLENPTAWDITQLNFLTAENEPDPGLAISKQFNYIATFGSQHVEFFYDAGTAPPGTVLAPAEAYVIKTGCASGNSVVSVQGTIVWVGQSKEAGKSVMMLNGLAPQAISTPAIEKILEADDLLNVRAWGYRVGGHLIYVLTLLDSAITLIYDFGAQTWLNWTYNGSNFLGLYFSFFKNTGYIQDGVGHLYSFSATVYQDNGVPIVMEGRTPLIDGENNDRKFFNDITAITDKTPVSSFMYLSYTDNDYQTFSTPLPVDVATDKPAVYSQGQSRRRAYQWTYSDNYPMRVHALDVSITKGM